MKFKGIMPATVTPLTADERINVGVLEQLLESQLAEGADGFYVGGATGEGLALKTEERFVLAEESVRIIGHRKPIIFQVAAMDFRDAIEIAKCAERAGADAISATPPIFFKYDEDDVYNYYRELAGAVNIPMMVYYSPAAAFPIDARFAARLFEIDNVSAIKWTSPNYYEMVKLKDMTRGEMNIINGPDEMLLMGLSAGADGGIGTTYNLMLPHYKKIYESFQTGNIEQAQREQTYVDRVIAALLRYKTIPATKAALERIGFAVGNASFPMKRYTEAQKDEIIASLRAAGFDK